MAIARTEPAWAGHPGTREIEALYLDAIAAARRLLYIENQFLTSRSISDALIGSLQNEQGPEVVLVCPRMASGWLEEATMGVLRARALRRVRDADRHGRFHSYHPVVPGLRPDECVNLHSKVMVVDDRLLLVGSANLTNRSLGGDTECDLVVESEGRPDVSRAVEAVRDRLLGEHLGMPPAEVGAALASGPGVEDLRGRGPRTLEPLEPAIPPGLDALIPDSATFDPEHAIDPEALASELVPRHRVRSAGRNTLRLLAAAVAGLVAPWLWTPQ